MKYFIVSLLSVVLSTTLLAQTDPNAPYQKDKNLPSFSLVSVDGKEITNKQMPTKYKYTFILIFSPDCSHCEHEAEELNKNMDKFKDVLFIWDSYRDMDAIKKFATKYNLAGKPNIIIGRDPGFTLPVFFRPRMTPFMAIYKNGLLVKIFEQGAEVAELVKIVQGN